MLVMTARWQQILAQGFGDAKSLLAYLGLSEQESSDLAASEFPVRVPKGFADRMVYGDAQDPLLKQVLAISQEMTRTHGYSKDPLSEQAQNPMPGLIHKYRGRILLTLSGTCAINCRYCFRRHFPYKDNTLHPLAMQQAISYLEKDTSIHEVILSGGDPLLLADKQLDRVMGQLESISHIRVIRFHTRIPIVLPERLTESLLTRLKGSRFPVVFVVHVNHPNELSSDLFSMFQALRQAEVHLLNQSVLLSQINDNVHTLTQLSHRLFQMGILPYYLHTLDKVDGAAHFDVDLRKARQLHQQLLEQLPGYLVPKLVSEVAGKPHKVWINDALSTD